MEATKEGSAVFVIHNGTLLLILRDDKPTIANPCTYALLAGAFEGEQDNDCFDTILREIYEEIRLRISRNRIKKIGTEKLTAEGKFNHFFLLSITDEEKNQMIQGEGQKMHFFRFQNIFNLHRLGDIKYGLGGAISRFMSHEREMILEIMKGECERFIIERK